MPSHLGDQSTPKPMAFAAIYDQSKFCCLLQNSANVHCVITDVLPAVNIVTKPKGQILGLFDGLVICMSDLF